MKVKLVNNWFAPKFEYVRDSTRIFSGQFFPKGEHVMPDELREFLPSSAIVIDETKAKKAEKDIPVPSLKDYDMERAAAEAEMKIQNEQNEKFDPMAKARAARAKKLEEKKAR